MLGAKRRDGIVDIEETKLITPPPMSPPGWRKCLGKAKGLRVSKKKNLTPTKIPIVANLLVSNHTISYFLHNRHLIYESLIPFSAP